MVGRSWSSCSFFRMCFSDACEVLVAISGTAGGFRARSPLAADFPNARGQQLRWSIRLRRPQEPEQPDRPMRLRLPHLTADAGRPAA